MPLLSSASGEPEARPGDPAAPGGRCHRAPCRLRQGSGAAGSPGPLRGRRM